MTEIILARHGETDWNSGRRVQGHTDIPLNAAGVDQARALAEQLAGEPLTAVFSSDLSRALDTARAVADVHGLEVTVDPRLREKNFGTWEGLTDVEIAERFPEARRGQWGDGETTEEVAERVWAFSSGSASCTRTGRCSWSPTEGRCAPPSPRWRSSTARSGTAPCFAAATEPASCEAPTTRARTATLRSVEDYTNKYKGEQVDLALFGGEYQEGVLTAYCSIEDVPHIELNGHILVPLQNVASLHCSSRCDAPEPDWPPRGLETDGDDRDDG